MSDKTISAADLRALADALKKHQDEPGAYSLLGVNGLYADIEENWTRFTKRAWK